MLSEYGITIAPSTYYAHRARSLGPSQTVVEEAYLANVVFDLWKSNRRLYGRRKLRRTAQRAGTIGRDQTERLMGICGISGIRRGKRRTVTTCRDDRAPRHPDHVQRRWTLPDRPDQWWVADFTYVWTTAGFCYVSFVTDVYSRRILGWRVTTSKTTPLVLSALEQALFTRRRTRMEVTATGLLHHSDAGSQYTSLAFTEALREAGIAGPSAPSATPSTTPSWNRPSACSRSRSLTTNARPGLAGGKWSRPPPNGSTGTTTSVSTPPSATSRQQNTKTTTTL